MPGDMYRNGFTLSLFCLLIQEMEIFIVNKEKNMIVSMWEIFTHENIKGCMRRLFGLEIKKFNLYLKNPDN